MVAVSESLHRALKHHEAGELDQAEALYRQIVRIDPGHIDALHLLGVAALQKADHRAGVEYISQAIAQGGNSALYHSNLGACYRAMNRLDEAIASFREAVRLEPTFVGARYNLAMALEAAGSIDEAIAEYHQVLLIDPRFFQALNNLGSLLSSCGRYDEATARLRQAIECCPNSAEFHYNLANTLSRAGNCEEAVNAYRESIRLNPNIPETYNNLATALHTLGRYDEALAELSKALELRPDYAEALVNQTTIEQSKAGLLPENDDATPAIEPLLPVNASAEQWCDKGWQLQNEDKFQDAAACFRRALELDPNWAAAYFGLGFGFLVAEKYEEAGKHYEQGLLIDDANAAAWNNLGSIYTNLEQWESAIACYESALQIDPAKAKAHYNLGNVYKDLGQPSEAAACYRRALYIDSTLAEAHINLGVVLQQQGRLEEAAASQTRATEIRPDDPEAHFQRALIWLLMGDLEKGWDAYEWRWKYDLQPRDFPFPVWNGGDLSEKTLLVYGEQGIGDEILFASCIPELLAEASQCLIECDPRLVPLFARSFPLAHVVGKPLSVEDARSYEVDLQIAAGSVPGLLRRNLDAFPKRQRFLAACPRRRAEWSDRYAELGTGLKVGISWRGGGKPAQNRRRSTVLEQWTPILRVPGVHFVNLQYGDCAAELNSVKTSVGVTIHHWPDADPLRDLEGFAAQIAELDLVISIDNSTVHMAGALGVPVWALLHFAPNWRWMLDRHDSPWYSSIRLVRQPEFGQWGPVFEGVAEQLHSLTTSRVSKTTTERPGVIRRLVLPALPTTDPESVSAAASVPKFSDPQAEEERAKYDHVWKFNEYRAFSPGAGAIENVGLVNMMRKLGVRTILDAGCGTGKLMWRLIHEFPGEFEVHGFDISDQCLDPCFAGIKDRILTVGCLWNPDDFTKVYDAVICTDVMEHIPTERVPAVLANLRKSTRRFAYFSISVVPDYFGPRLLGEALHLTIKKPNWWFAKLALAGFTIGSQAAAMTGQGNESQLHVFATV